MIVYFLKKGKNTKDWLIGGFGFQVNVFFLAVLG